MQRMIEYGKSRVHPGRSYAYSAKEYHAHPDRDGTGGEGAGDVGSAGDDFDDYHGDRRLRDCSRVCGRRRRALEGSPLHRVRE